ncbi:D-alanine--poly(phosphoribitol) ligase, subunit 2 [Desulfosporosinus acidiphilus SJ4]|uniref:D-alanyl carrier protein n=1 Tax=Desulfosporosinus acidiphilus (strain DSM 22704 / JCM 16185 / SJ4) TaxID=646529 RepID=I4D8Z8_DESAJ|nr:D-alanine--poly(phosphoribitol) ligase subunit DltC [Desulfosporosinus acidiphilus]AFM42272.1 D-alanine--poly(phosphoribitol) ligase, subunit 2 [Desulfosporosinus acidiphilus SJ4]
MNDDSIVRTTILSALSEICGTDKVMSSPDLDLFVTGLLDSFGLVELMLAIHEQLDMEIAPTEVDREMWSTPNKIIQYLEEKR